MYKKIFLFIFLFSEPFCLVAQGAEEYQLSQDDSLQVINTLIKVGLYYNVLLYNDLYERNHVSEDGTEAEKYLYINADGLPTKFNFVMTRRFKELKVFSFSDTSLVHKDFNYLRIKYIDRQSSADIKVCLLSVSYIDSEEYIRSFIVLRFYKVRYLDKWFYEIETSRE
jgi:hypothetical protein